MRFESECELCKKQVKRGQKFNFDLFERDDDTMSSGVAGADEICTSCARKIERKIESMRK